MKKRIWKFILWIGMLFVLSGCMFQSGEEFYALPQLPDDYLALQETINQVMKELGAEYAAPSSGNNVQTIQLQDLDGTGERESAVAFFRVANAEKPLKIYIFRQNPLTGEYKTEWIIEGDGTAIYSVSFENLGGSADKELVVSWQISSKVHSLAAYSLQLGGNVVELMRSGYTKNAIVDLDRDNEKEIVLVQLDAAENNSRAELYKYSDGMMLHTSAAPLSQYITSVQSAKVGTLTDMVPALFVSSNFGENGGRVTDIIAMQDDVLTNLTLDTESGVEMSLSTIRYYNDFTDANGLDINDDGVLELPMEEPLPLVSETGTLMYLLHWYQFDRTGAAERVCITFHNYEDGWYMILPEGWRGNVTVARRDSGSTSAGSERAISFYYWPEGNPELEPEEFLTIYRLSGTNRSYRASVDNRVTLVETSDVIYAAKLRESQWDSGLDIDELRLESFNRIKISWSDDD